MTRPLTDSELEAYLDEALTPPEMAAIEAEVGNSPKLLKQLAKIHSRRDAGVHSLGEIAPTSHRAAPRANRWVVSC